MTSFKENAHALEEWQRCLAEDRAALSEMQARGDGTAALTLTLALTLNP